MKESPEIGFRGWGTAGEGRITINELNSNNVECWRMEHLMEVNGMRYGSVYANADAGVVKRINSIGNTRNINLTLCNSKPLPLSAFLAALNYPNDGIADTFGR